jgi:sulfide:quinone oxidoreductase
MLRVLVLGAGFGGLEVTSILSERLGRELELTLIDRRDSFFFGYSKLDVMFGHKAPAAVRIAYSNISKPGVRFRREEIVAIDAAAKRVKTSRGTYEADAIVVALGADYDVPATPGLAQGGNEFYSFSGAKQLRQVLPTFSSGQVIIGATGKPFKATGAVSEAALLLNDYLTARGVRDACTISLVLPFGAPIPPSPGASQALREAFAERGITFVPERLVRALDPSRHVAILDDETEMPYDLFLGVPKHRAPEVVSSGGLTENGWIPVNPKTLETRFLGVYAIGDVTNVATPKTGGFAESAARVVAARLIADQQGSQQPGAYTGTSTGYLEFGGGRVGRLDFDFFSGPSPKVGFAGPSVDLADEKERADLAHRRRWFGL